MVNITMCTYTGGKARIGKKIFEAIDKYEMEVIGNHKMPYLEPFVGMGGVLQEVAKKHSREMIACDLEKCIPAFWNSIKKGWSPSRITKEKYLSIKKEGIEDAEYAFAAFGCSFRGSKWTYFYENCMNAAIKRIQKKNYTQIMKNVIFLESMSYKDHSPHGMLIYCDPPYFNSSFDYRRNNLNSFDTDEFWEIMRQWSKDNLVIISELEAPSDFKSIFSLDRTNTFNNTRITENLFVLKESLQ